MKILFASAEGAPFFKTGGLGDVAYSLPKALQKKGIEVAVILPYFTGMPAKYQEALQYVDQFSFELGTKAVSCLVYHYQYEQLTYYFLRNDAYFDREQLYGYPDDGERFGFFSQGILQWLVQTALGKTFDVLHVNDHHTALIPYLLKTVYQAEPVVRHLASVLTIHNLEFQGQYAPELLPEVYGIELTSSWAQMLSLNEGLNCLKIGLQFADQITTVSPTYAREIQTPAQGFGLDQILVAQSEKLTGIVNGIDEESNNPATDPDLIMPFSVQDLRGKATNKRFLQRKVGLPQNEKVPVIGMISRLTSAKGFDLVCEVLPTLLQEEVQVILLGTGDPAIEAKLVALAQAYPEKLTVDISFNAEFAQQIYAGSDLFLMPSRTEPCGLAQMLAMHYGALPVVHAVGGLKDTVQAIEIVGTQQTASGTGFTFDEFSVTACLASLERALNSYHHEPAAWQQWMKQAMLADFSWGKSSQAYTAIYQKASQMEPVIR